MLLHLPFLFVAMFVGLALTASASEFPTPYNSEPGNAQPPSPKEALAMLRLPEGFTASIFAAEPTVMNPIATAWDAKGRLWVAENNTYAERAKRFDLGLRDRVIILEDADNDGVAESRKVFTDAVQMLTSVEVGRGGVWLMCPPQLLFIPDADGDDVPDGPPQVMLDGFTVAKDNYHNFANGLRWGPDGWLYGRCGHSCPGMLGVPGTPEEERMPIQGGIWRYQPEKHLVEVLTHGTTNPWGHDWDKNGECFFINTVTGHLWHLMPGAHLKDSNPSPNPGVYEKLDTIADHYHFDTKGGWQQSRDGKASDLGGGHAHIGMMIYQGTQWPEQYRDKLFTLNMHGRRANVERLDQVGCGFIGRHEHDVFFSDDSWFRGMEITTGPDGNGYLVDWSDSGECHESTGVHRSSGRIYKVSYGKPTAPKPMLQPYCMNGPGKLPELWKQYQAGKATSAKLRESLHDQDEHIRVWAIRLLTDLWPLDTMAGKRPAKAISDLDAQQLEVLKEFMLLAEKDSSGLVHLALASTLQRLPVQHRTELALPLVKHSEHAGDAQLPSLVWYGLTPLGQTDPMALVTIAKSCQWPTTMRWLTHHLAAQIEKRPEPFNALLMATFALADDVQDSVMLGMADAFKGWRKAPQPASWKAFTKTAVALRNATATRELSSLFGDGRALDDIKKLALDDKVDTATRQAALKTLIDARGPDLRSLCETLLEVRGLTATAVRGLAQFEDEAIGQRLAQSYRKFSTGDKAAVLDTLTSRPSFALALLNNVGAGNKQIPRNDISAFHARQIRGFNNEALSNKLREVWGESRDSAADKTKLIATLKAKLTADVLAKADRGQGRLLFSGICAACHTLYGEGGKIGPDLTGSGRANLDYLLENIADPSAVVSADFRMSTLTLKDGRVLNGIVTAQSDRTLTLRSITEVLTIELTDVVKQDTSPLSMMPEGLLLAMNETQTRDLIAYLMHPVQVPLPSATK